jgi:hypothetical protein
MSTWCLIHSSGYEALQVEKALEHTELLKVEVPKWITVVVCQRSVGRRSSLGDFSCPEFREKGVSCIQNY